MADKWDALLGMGKGISGVGALFGGPFAQQANASNDYLTSAMVAREMERQQKEREKQRKASRLGGLGEFLGSTAGAVIGNMILPGAGSFIGAGLGAAAGKGLGTKAGGGDVELGDLVRTGLTAGATTWAAPKVFAGAANFANRAGLEGLENVAGRLEGLPTWLGSHAGAKWGPNAGLAASGFGRAAQGKILQTFTSPILGFLSGAYQDEEQERYPWL